MTKNVGGIDRAIRIVAGLFGLSLVVWGPRTYLGLFGLIPLVSGLAGYCPPYTWLGISTCRKSRPTGTDTKSS
jgi:hypothetical protein